MKRVLIAGCGDLGARLAEHRDSARWQLTGLRRDPSGLPASIRPLRADLLDPGSMAQINRDWDAVIYQATPARRDEPAYRQIFVDGLRNLLGQICCQRLIFVSSTAVYGQNSGEWVDEDSPTEPAAFNGRVLREAEVLAMSTPETASIVVRFSGIYGPGRESLVCGLKAGSARCRRQPPQWTNRIHVDDCAGVLAHLLELTDPLPIYCASDSQPTPRCEVLGWLAEQLGVPGPETNDADDHAGQGKRIANRRLLDSGFQFRYPDYRSGYGAMLS